MNKVCLVGASGRMGAMLTELAPDLFACGIDKIDSDRPYPVYQNFNDIPQEIISELKGVLDFSNPETFNNTLNFALKNKLALAVGTTGLTEEMKKEAGEAGKDIPILVTSNMSIGVNTLLAHLPGIIESLQPGYDIEIIEKHHNKKVDAPSGTALLIADTINKGSGNKYHYVFDRSKVSQPRDEDEIGIVSIRSGTLPGEHSVILAGNDEVIEIKHTAYSRKIFAEGALKAIRWLMDQQPGFYSYQDVIIK